MNLILIGLFAFAVVFGVVYFKLKSAHHQIKQVLKANFELNRQVRAQRVEIKQKDEVIKSGQIQRKNSESVKRINAHNVDGELQKRGWLRAETDHHGLSGVQSDFSKPSGYDRDETPSARSQSDL